MSGTNPAQAAGGDEALSVDDGADAISDLIQDPATDLPEKDQGEQDEEGKADGDEPEAEQETSDEEAKQEDNDESKDYESGKFASDTANVRLKDGTVISVQDLKRGYLAQQSFTRGSQENARERETLASQKTEVEQFARALQAQRDFLLQVSQLFAPQPPDESLLNQNSPNYDPIRYMAQKADYDKKANALTQLQYASQADQARAAQDQQRQRQELRDKEAQRLLDAMPELKKPAVYQKFWDEAVETMSEYGFSPEELNDAIDHRLYPVYRDLAAYRRARKSLPTVKQAVQSKPVLTGQKRMDPKAKISREQQARQEQLRKTGTFEAGVSALMDLDL